MPKYMIQAKLTTEGLKGTLDEGGTKREAAITKAIESLGGRMEVYYYAFGEYDVVGIADVPDNVSAAAFAMIVTMSGGATCSTTVLLTPEEVDQVSQKTVAYRKPGG